MATAHTKSNQVRAQRLARGWSQEELAERSGISRAGISAIEGQRLTPSVGTALSLARVLECSVEELFGGEPGNATTAVAWGWPGTTSPCRYWSAEVGGRNWAYPVEMSEVSWQPHDGVAQTTDAKLSIHADASRTLVLACCDPAAELLAREFAGQTGLRMLVLSRSSSDALELLNQGLVHVAGIHLSNTESSGGNAAALQTNRLQREMRLLHVSQWQLGVAVRSDEKLHSIRRTLSEKLRWVGRTEGAGARRCQNQLLGDRKPPTLISRTHRGVAAAIRDGWADAGVTVRLSCEEAQLDFLPVCADRYDLCFPKALARDPRVVALVQVVRSAAYRAALSDLPGYQLKNCGELENVVPSAHQPAPKLG